MSPRDVLPYLAASLVLLAVTLAMPRHAAPTRVAIRVDCHVPGACERARAVALDVWSEDEGPGLPLDLVVTSDELSSLAAWQVIVPDIDAAARAERERMAIARPADWFGEYRDY